MYDLPDFIYPELIPCESVIETSQHIPATTLTQGDTWVLYWVI